MLHLVYFYFLMGLGDEAHFDILGWISRLSLSLPLNHEKIAYIFSSRHFDFSFLLQDFLWF